MVSGAGRPRVLTFASESKIAGQRISRPASSRSWLLAMVAKVAGRWLAGVNTRPDVARHCSSTHDACCESRAARRAP